jgi:hypothetical protein
MRVGANAATWLVRHSVSSRGAATGAINVSSIHFAKMRAEGAPFVDKTDAIADLLCSGTTERAFFVRPRKFGKSLTLDIMAALLRAGKLPLGVAPWGGYEPVDAAALFSGLAVHKRFQQPNADDVALHTPHFVVHLGLAGAQTGTKLEASIFAQLRRIATNAFGTAVGAKVARRPTPSDALATLLKAVPKGVPTAVLVDEYDAAIVRDVSKQRWAEADAGIDALRSLLLATKAPGVEPAHFVVTGVARFARTLLLSGANNFTDITTHPALCRAIGFTRREIENVFARELEALVVLPSAKPIGLPASDASPASGSTTSSLPSISTKLDALEWWFNGYCFDGQTTCFNPYGVLQALQAGKLRSTELDGASGINWLGLGPASVLEKLWQRVANQPRVSLDAVQRIDIADLEAKTVDVQAMLLQVGLLTLHSEKHQAAGSGQQRLLRGSQSLLCQVPNEYARVSLRAMAQTALGGMQLSPYVPALVRALQRLDADEFGAVVKSFLQGLPHFLVKKGVGPGYEAPFHAALWAFLHSCVPTQVAVTVPEAADARGRADILIRFPHAPVVWVMELGVGSDTDAKKLAQAQRYAKAHAVGDSVEVVCCAISVSKADLPAASVSDRSGGAATHVAKLIWDRTICGKKKYTNLPVA